jgi:hypothetical protein
MTDGLNWKILKRWVFDRWHRRLETACTCDGIISEKSSCWRRLSTYREVHVGYSRALDKSEILIEASTRSEITEDSEYSLHQLDHSHPGYGPSIPPGQDEGEAQMKDGLRDPWTSGRGYTRWGHDPRHDRLDRCFKSSLRRICDVLTLSKRSPLQCQHMSWQVMNSCMKMLVAITSSYIGGDG